MEPILILGARGLLGSSLYPYLKKKGYQVFGQSRFTGLDFKKELNSVDDFKTLLKESQAQTVINLVAMTNVDECEKNIHQAFLTNVRFNENLALALQNSKAHVIHISTDHIYDGEGLKKEDNITIHNIYALSKYAGELPLKNISSTILRTNFFGKSHGEKKSFSDWLIQAMKNNEALNLFQDSYFSPLHLSTLCEAIHVVLKNPQKGIFNLGSTTFLSKADFALRIGALLNLKYHNYTLVSCNQDGKVKRPTNMAMDSSLFEETFNFQLNDLDSELRKLNKELQ